MRVIKSERRGNLVVIGVWLDESMTQPDGAPDPSYVVEMTWPVRPPLPLTPYEWVTVIRTELALTCRRALAERRGQPEPRLPDVGESLG